MKRHRDDEETGVMILLIDRRVDSFLFFFVFLLRPHRRPLLRVVEFVVFCFVSVVGLHRR